MPRIELEIMGTKTVSTDERITVVVDVPQDVLDDPFALREWVDKQLQDASTELSKEVNKDDNIEVADETEDYEVTEVNDLGPAED